MARVYRVNGEEILARPGWNVIDKINARSTVSLVSDDIKNLTDVFNGQSVEIFTDETETEKIFAGIIKKKTRSEEDPGFLRYAIKVADNSALADKRIIAKSYTNMQVGDIARDLITEKLAEEGVTEGTIEGGPVIALAVFNYITVAAALDYLKKTTGYIWNIDKNKQLNMTSRTAFTAPFTLDDTVQHKNFKHEQNMDQYRNTEYGRGGKAETDQLDDEEPSPEPDGVSRTFTLRFPVSGKPAIKVNSIAVDPDDIGINGKDTGKEWYYTIESATITQDNAQPILTPGDTLEVTYKGLRDLFISIDSPIQIEARKNIETGTSGIYEHLTIEKSLSSTTQGAEFLNGLIETYGEITDKVMYSTNVPGLEAGMIQKVNKPLYNLNSEFLIESVTMRPDGPKDITYDIVALDGAAIGGWEEFFKEITRKQAEFIINENEVIILIQNQEERYDYSGTYELGVFQPITVDEDVICAETLICGEDAIQEVTIND